MRRLTRAPLQVVDDRLASSQPLILTIRLVEAGNLTSLSKERDGRATSGPPQFGHLPLSECSAHAAQKVHSNEQMRASGPKDRVPCRSTHSWGASQAWWQSIRRERRQLCRQHAAQRAGLMHDSTLPLKSGCLT